jgi:hypothetical protein
MSGTKNTTTARAPLCAASTATRSAPSSHGIAPAPLGCRASPSRTRRGRIPELISPKNGARIS